MFIESPIHGKVKFLFWLNAIGSKLAKNEKAIAVCECELKEIAYLLHRRGVIGVVW